MKLPLRDRKTRRAGARTSVRLAALMLGAGLVAACNPQAEGEPAARIELRESTKTAKAEPEPPKPEGPAPDSACKRVSFEGVPLTHCIADPAKHRIRTALAPKGGKPWRSFAGLKAAMGDSSDVVFAMNAGPYNGDGKPLGYYVENKNRLHELNRGSGDGNFYLKPNGVFYGTGKNWRLRSTDDFYRLVGDRPGWGVQSGPMLVIAGKLHPKMQSDGPSETIRNGVGLDGAGRAHFVISEGPLSFGKMARFFRDELKTSNALFLGSGAASSLWDPASERMDRRGAFGPMLVVTRIAPKADTSQEPPKADKPAAPADAQ